MLLNGRAHLLRPGFRPIKAPDRSVLATVHVHPYPFTDARKRQIQVVRLDTSNRDLLPRELADRLTADRLAVG